MNIFESNGPPQGERATETAHRKIELQSPADLTYLIANVSRAARDKIDRDIPPDAAPEGEEDEMRKRIGQLVDDYIRDTFKKAKDSMSINGMDSKEMEAELARAQEGEEIEAFDTKLAQRVQALSTQIEHQTLQLANLRREAPAQTARRYEEAFARQSQVYDERLQNYEESRIANASATKANFNGLERWEEVRDNWRKGTEELTGLKDGLDGTISKLERAQRAMTFVEGQG